MQMKRARGTGPSTIESDRDPWPFLRTLAEPNRLRLFRTLRQAERCVRELCELTELSQPLASHHLAQLVDAGLVRTRRQGSYTLYALDPIGMTQAAAACAALLDPSDLPPEARPGGNPQCCQ
jgi:DNA-binding transcriptional ArsR family regulator